MQVALSALLDSLDTPTQSAATDPASDAEASASQQPDDQVTVPTLMQLPFLTQQHGDKPPVVSAVAAGRDCTAVLTWAPDKFPESPTARLWETLQTAIDNAAEIATSATNAEHLKPIVTAVELVFGSAAALSATFGYKVSSHHHLSSSSN